MRDASLGIRRRVVVQNLPPISTLLEEERERSARGHRVTAPQREARRAKREVKREGAHAHLVECERVAELDRKSTRLNSSHVEISYAVFCLKKKNSHLTLTQGVASPGNGNFW